MIKKYIVLFLILMFSEKLISSELDLEAAIKLAIDNNKEIQIARADVETAEANKREAWSTALPTINANLDYKRNFSQTYFYVNGADFGRFSFTFKNEYLLTTTLNQTIYSFGKVGTALKIANDYGHYVKNQFNDKKNMVLANVKKAFYQALLNEKIKIVSRDSQESARSNYENTKARYESGTVSEFDLLQAEVRWQNTIPDTLESAKNFQLALNNLKSLLNIPISEKLILSGNLENIQLPIQTIPYEQVLENRPDYKAMQWELKMRRKNIRLEFANHLPDLSGQLSYSYSAISDRFQLDNENKNLVMGVSLNIPVFSGGFTSARVQKARIDTRKLETHISQQEDKIQIDLENVRLRLREAQLRINSAQKSVKSANRAYEIAEIRVKNGLATQLELKDSRVFLDQARLNYYKATFDYLSAYFDWEITTGIANRG